MFRGNHQTRVDDKFRLKLPAEFKRRVDEVYGPQFYITSTNGRRAQLYPLKEWEAIEAEIVKLPITDLDRIRFEDVTSYYGGSAEMDTQGRLLLPSVIRGTAKLTGDVNVLGKLTNLDVANLEMFEMDMRGPSGVVEISLESQASLAEKMKALVALRALKG
jgi:MraZ protein